MSNFLSYQEVAALNKNDRVLVREYFTGLFIPGTIVGSGTLNSSPSFWIQFDGDSHSTNIPNGLQFKKENWDESHSAYRFMKLREPNLFEQEGLE